MAGENAVMAVIRASRPSFRNSHDKLAFTLHASFLAAGYVLTATGKQAFSDPSESPSGQQEVGIEGWNEMEGSYGFVYFKSENGCSKSVSVKCLAIGETLMVDVLRLDKKQEPFNLQINVNDYVRESTASNNYGELYKNLQSLVVSINSEVLLKVEDPPKQEKASSSSRSETDVGSEHSQNQPDAGHLPENQSCSSGHNKSPAPIERHTLHQVPHAATYSTDLESRRRKLLHLNLLAAATAAAGYFVTYMNKRPCRGSSLGGAAYVKEILQGHPTHCRDICRMELPTFKKLCEIVRSEGLLHNTAGVEVEEQLAMFLFTIGHNASNRQVQERFQHSGETISRHFNNVLNALTELSSRYIRLPSSNTPPEIRNQPEFFPYFKDCIGAIDGIHIPVTVDVENQVPYRNRKGFLSQNVMAACSFDLRFLYVLAGWEGSASESTVLQAALKSGFQVPKGKFYLVGGRYGNTPSFLSPYRGVRSHLKEFGHGNQAPQNAKELFNLQHASLRNAIERTFGVLEKRFPIIKVATSYPYESQVKLVLVACTLHNHIRIETGGEDWLYEEYDFGIQTQLSQQDDCLEAHTLEDASTTMQRQAGNALRDSIANAMWEGHCNQ